MPNVATLLKAEITRISRKEVRLLVEPLRKQSVALKREVAALKRDRDDLRREIAQLSKATRRRTAETAEPAASPKARFSPSGLKSLRKRLGLSAADFGKLAGSSGQSVYLWEQEKARPRPQQVARIAALRAISKREAARRLEASA